MSVPYCDCQAAIRYHNDIEKLGKVISKLLETPTFKIALLKGVLDLEEMGFIVEHVKGKLVVGLPFFDRPIFTLS